MLDARALGLLTATPPSAASEAAASAASYTGPPAGAGGPPWTLALLGLSSLLILTAVFSPALAGASRAFDALVDRRAELVGIGLVVLAAVLVTGGAGL
jgi:hypothetical protein